MTGFQSAWNRYSNRTEQALEARLIEGPLVPERLHQAMAYSCLGGGKRFRAMLVYVCGQVAGATMEQLDTPACAVEMIHAYSLTHDDLPAMDDDDLRRGRAACHIAFDEALAILAGDALQSRAFEILASSKWNDIAIENRIAMIEQLAKGVGALGMAGGQALDMEATGQSVDYSDLVQIHDLKTGSLIESSAIIGCLAAENASDELLTSIRTYGSCIGLAFQILDDILDCTSNSQTLGKVSGADQIMNKATCVSILGLDAARAEAGRLAEQAGQAIRGSGENRDFLEQLANFVVTRSY